MRLTDAQPFEGHTLWASLYSSLFLPLLALGQATILPCRVIDLVAAAGLSDKQPFIKTLRLLPFLSAASTLHYFILSCCELLAVEATVDAVGAVAGALPWTNVWPARNGSAKT